MDPTILLTAIVTGASLALKNTTSQAIQDAYTALKSIVIERFRVGSVSALEKDPSDESFKNSFIKEVNLTPGIMDDMEIKRLISKLYEIIERDVNKADLASVGVDIGEIISNRDTVVNNIQGFDIGFRSQKISSGQDTRIENIAGKKET